MLPTGYFHLLGPFSLNPRHGRVRVKIQDWHFVRQSHQKPHQSSSPSWRVFSTLANRHCHLSLSKRIELLLCDCHVIAMWFVLTCLPAFCMKFPSTHGALNGSFDIFAPLPQPHLGSAVSGRLLLHSILVDTDEIPSVCMRRQENVLARRRSAQPWMVST